MTDLWLLDTLDDEERRQVLAAARRRRFKRGDTIFHEGDLGDGLHLIEKGHVAIRVSTITGEVATLTVLGPGQGFGEGALLAADSRRTASAIAIGPTETRTLVRAEFERLRVEHPRIERLLTEALAMQVRRLSAHLLEALYVPVDARLVRRLLVLADTFSTGSRDGGIADGVNTPMIISVTQEDLATMAGTTRPTANRVLKDLEAGGFVAVRRGRIEILDRPSLERRAG